MNLKEMSIESSNISHERGWYDSSRTFGDFMALLHSEVSEILEAYRDAGIVDQTKLFVNDDGQSRMVVNPKPEGVGAEMADVLIRLLDTCETQGIDLGEAVAAHTGVYGINVGFGDAVNQLHNHITRLSLAGEDYMGWNDGIYSQTPISHYYAAIYVYLRDWAKYLGVDLQAEYRRKTEFNKTRPYRHGGKRL